MKKNGDLYRFFRAKKWRMDILFRKITNRFPEPSYVSELEIDGFIEQAKNKLGNENIIDFYVDSKEWKRFLREFRFDSYLSPYYRRFKRKTIEYYFTSKILCFENVDKEYKYIDAASSSSPWAKMLREKYGFQAYSLDIQTPENASDCFIESDVSDMPFENETIDSISCQSALEVFPEDVDIKFISEACRVIKKGGKIVICPLYLNQEYCNVYGWSYFNESIEESGSSKKVRLDYNMSFTRLYDFENLYKRIILPAIKMGCSARLYSVNCDNGKKLLYDRLIPYIYFRFALVIEKAQ